MKLGFRHLGSVFLCLSLFSMVASANKAAPPDHTPEMPLEKVPPLYGLYGFQSETDPHHYVILGKDGIYMDAGNWYVLNVQNGTITSPVLKKDSYFWFGGGFDFKFETGEWLYVGGGNSAQDAPGATNEVVDPGLIHPTRGREPLRRVSLNKDLLDKLGVTPLISPDTFKHFEERPAYQKSKAPDGNIVLLALNFDDKNKDRIRKLRDQLQESRACIISRDYWGSRVGTLYVWAFESQVARIEDLAYKKLKKKFTMKKRSILDPNTNRTQDRQGFSKVPALVSIIDWVNTGQLAATEDNVEHWIYETESVLKNLQELEYPLEEMWENAGPARARFVENFRKPLLEASRRAYEILAKMQTPAAREILFFAGEHWGGRVHLLHRPSGVGSETFFQTWLSTLKEKASWIMNVSKEEQKTARGSFSSGGILSHFGFMGVTARSSYSPEEYRLDRITFLPLLALGLRENSTAASDLIRFVIEMDKVAEFQFKTQRRKDDDRFYGSSLLTSFLGSLAGMGSRWIAEETPGFSKSLYYTQAMAVVSELLNTSRVTIVNSLTYLTLLNAAVGLQKAVLREFGIVPNATVKSDELDALTEQLVRLQQAVQVRMIRAVFMDPNPRNRRDPESCPGALGAI